MGYIKWMGIYEFSQGNLRVLWDLGEKTEQGLEIEIDLDKPSGDLDGLGNWSFGMDYITWEKWGEWIERRVQECKEGDKRLEKLIEYLNQIECSWNPENECMPPLRDLSIIQQLIKADRILDLELLKN